MKLHEIRYAGHMHVELSHANVYNEVNAVSTSQVATPLCQH